MTDKSRAAFEAWHNQRAQQIKDRAKAIAAERIADGFTDSGPTRKSALIDAVMAFDDTGWAAWQASREVALNEAAKQKASKPRQLARCGTGALHDEQQYCFELGYKAGAKSVRTTIKGLK